MKSRLSMISLDSTKIFKNCSRLYVLMFNQKDLSEVFLKSLLKNKPNDKKLIN